MDSPSKSELKRQANRQKELGVQLAKLKSAQLAQFDISDKLRTAVAEYKRFRSNGARKRQMLFIAKLLRSENSSTIEQHLNQLTHHRADEPHRFRALELWRTRLLDNNDTLEKYLSSFPDTPRRELIDLIEKSRTSSDKKYPRLLFRFLSENEKNHLAG